MRYVWLLAVLAIALAPRAMAAPQPFQLLEGQVVITVTVGGRETLALFDTGAERSMIEAGLASELGLTAKTPTSGGAFGVSGKSLSYGRTDTVEMIVGGQTLSPPLTVFPSGSAFAAKNVRILIGRDLFARSAVTLDFEHMTIDLTPSAQFKPPEGAPLKLSDPSGWGGPVLRIDVNGKPADVVLDTAATGSLHLTSRFVRDAGLITGRETSTRTITGLDGTYERKVFILPSVTIASEPFGNVPATILSLGRMGRMQNPIDGVVGVDLLRQFNLTIDYANNQVWLTPNRKPPN